MDKPEGGSKNNEKTKRGDKNNKDGESDFTHFLSIPLQDCMLNKSYNDLMSDILA